MIRGAGPPADAPQLFQDIQAKCRLFQNIQAKCRQNPISG